LRKAYLGIGTNLGDRENNLRQAVSYIQQHTGEIVRASSVYETEPWGFKSMDHFLNMVVEIATELSPTGLLGRLLMIESLMGRLRENTKYTSRVIDIDILLYGNQVINKGDLIIPHPRMHERKFVLFPLSEIAPGFVHPVLKKSISRLIPDCTDNGEVVRVAHSNPLSAKL
jgi:2-amino-4-hydroxy-6-hydroxymethyldihydropteridine diphosphokinase